MATKNWTLLREAILKMNKQRYLSVMQGRNKFTTSTNSRTLYHNTNKVTDTGFQKKEINNPGEGLHRNELAITGKVIRSKSSVLVTSMSLVEDHFCSSFLQIILLVLHYFAHVVSNILCQSNHKYLS